MSSEVKYPVFFFLALFLCSFAPVARAQSAESLARQGNEYFKQGNFQKAVDAYRQAMIRNPQNPLIKYNLGTALAKAGQLEEAQKMLSESAEIKGSPRRRDSYFNKGVTLGEAAIHAPEIDPAASGGQGQGGAPGQAQAEMAMMQQRIDWLKTSLGALRNDILLDTKDEEAIYNYETVQSMLRKLQAEMEQMKQKQQNQQQQGGQQNQQQQGQGKNQNQQQGQKGQSGQQNQQGPQQNQNNQSTGEGEELNPEQIDANALLNLLEAEKPEQFKNLFKFRGGEKPQRPRKDW